MPASCYALCSLMNLRLQGWDDRFSKGFGERVLEVIRMLAVGDLDRHLAGQPLQLTGARVGHHRDTQLRFAARHGATVLEHKAALTAMQRAADPLNGDITG